MQPRQTIKALLCDWPSPRKYSIRPYGRWPKAYISAFQVIGTIEIIGQEMIRGRHVIILELGDLQILSELY